MTIFEANVSSRFPSLVYSLSNEVDNSIGREDIANQEFENVRYH